MSILSATSGAEIAIQMVFQVPWQRFILLVFAFPSDFFVRRDLTEWPDKK
jgi:hypothetical protein